MNNLMEELTRYRVKVEKDGKEIMNVPSILALPGALLAPKISIVGTVAASFLGCDIHLENEDGHKVDVGKAVKDAADTVVNTARTASKTVREEIEKAWNDLSADDPEGCPEGEENEDDSAEDASFAETARKTAEEIVEDLEKHETDSTPVIHVEDPQKPE